VCLRSPVDESRDLARPFVIPVEVEDGNEMKPDRTLLADRMTPAVDPAENRVISGNTVQQKCGPDQRSHQVESAGVAPRRSRFR